MSTETKTELVGTVLSLRGLMVEVSITGAKPTVRELLSVEGHPEVFLEVNFYRAGKAICLNVVNSQVLSCGQKIYRTGKTVTLLVDRYYFSQGSKVAVLDLGTPQGVDNVDAYRLMSESFAWTK